jgi:septal ring factor EnvC (AmiA/AmiB activator)
MKEIVKLVAFLLLAGVFLSACTTTTPSRSVKGQVRDNRPERLEKAPQSDQAIPSNIARRLDKVDRELKDIRRAFADSKLDSESLMEIIDSLKAQVADLEQFIVKLRNRGSGFDKSLENLANKLEADIRGLGDKVKEYLEQ